MIVTVLAAIVILVPLWFLFLKPAKTPVSQSGPSIIFSLYDHAVYEGTDTVVKEIKMENIESIHFVKQTERCRIERKERKDKRGCR